MQVQSRGPISTIWLTRAGQRTRRSSTSSSCWERRNFTLPVCVVFVIIFSNFDVLPLPRSVHKEGSARGCWSGGGEDQTQTTPAPSSPTSQEFGLVFLYYSGHLVDGNLLFVGTNLTPTVELNAWATQRGKQVEYQVLQTPAWRPTGTHLAKIDIL